MRAAAYKYRALIPLDHDFACDDGPVCLKATVTRPHGVAEDDALGEDGARYHDPGVPGGDGVRGGDEAGAGDEKDKSHVAEGYHQSGLDTGVIDCCKLVPPVTPHQHLKIRI